MKKTIIMILIIAILSTALCACGQNAPNPFEEVGKIISESPDSISNGMFIKGYNASDIGYSEGGYQDLYLGIGYTESTKEITILITYSNNGTEMAQSIYLPGAVAKTYKYNFTFDSGSGDLLALEGLFEASNLKTSTKFSYSDYDFGSFQNSSNEQVILSNMQEAACFCATIAVKAFKAFLEHNNCNATVEDFGFIGF